AGHSGGDSTADGRHPGRRAGQDLRSQRRPHPRFGSPAERRVTIEKTPFDPLEGDPVIAPVPWTDIDAALEQAIRRGECGSLPMIAERKRPFGSAEIVELGIFVAMVLGLGRLTFALPAY